MNLNDKIKEALQNDVPQWEDDLVWDNIEEALPKKEKRKFWIFFLPLGLLMLSTISYLYVSKSDETISSIQKDTVSINHTTSTKANTNELSVASFTGKKETAIPNLIEEKKKTPARQKTSVTDSKDKSYELNPFKTVQQNNKSYEIFTKLVTTEVRSNSLAVKKLIADSSSIPTAKELSKLQLLPIYIQPFPYKQNPFLKRKTIGLPNESSTRKGNIYVSLGVFNPNRNLTSTTNLDWINQKNELENVMESSDFSIGYEKRIAQKISFSLGLGFRQLVEISEFRDSISSMQTIPSDSAYVVNGVSYLPGELIQTTTQGRITKTPNRLRKLYLPLRLGYHIPIQKNTLKLEAGANIDLYTSYSGTAFNYDYTRTKNQSEINSIYNRKISLSELSFTSTYHIPIAKKYKLSLGLTYLHGLKNHLNHTDYQLKYNSLGAKLGFNIPL